MSHVASAPNRALAFSRALFEELARSGLRHVCIAPGSRSAPLALAAAEQPGLRCWTHVDERSAGFFALGLARAARAPVAIVCTSGTAAANLHPAVIEACYGRVPLLVLTADRPHELREWDAGQTIDQVRLFGSHVRWFAETAPPEASGPALRHARALGCRALAEACGRTPGPVHLNLPFREPLAPVPDPGSVPEDLATSHPLAARGRAARSYTSVERPLAAPTRDQVGVLADLVRRYERGVIACGPLDAEAGLAAAVVALARAAGWPILADPTSQMRCGPHVGHAPIVSSADLFLRDPALASELVPDCVLRLGATPISRAFRLWLERRPPAEIVLLDPGEGWSDPSHLVSTILRADPRLALEEVAAAVGATAIRRNGPWLRTFLALEARSTGALEQAIAAETALLAPRIVRELGAALPEHALLYVANSMAVRDLDAFLPVSPRPLRVLCNRGANGIDGLVSSALGAAAAGAGPTILLTGDLGLLHDLSGLAAVRRLALDLVIVVLNDDGGGIFSYLPVAEHAGKTTFESLFAVPHGLELGPVAEALGLRFARAAGPEHLRALLKDAFASGGAHLIEVALDRQRNVAHHHELVRAVAETARSGEGLR